MKSVKTKEQSILLIKATYLYLLASIHFDLVLVGQEIFIFATRSVYWDTAFIMGTLVYINTVNMFDVSP